MGQPTQNYEYTAMMEFNQNQQKYPLLQQATQKAAQS